MKMPTGKLKTFFHSLLGLAVGMVVIYFSLNFLRTHGPAIIQGPAGTVGDAISGQRWNF